MNALELKAAFHSGKRVYGTMTVAPSPLWVSQIKRLNLDFVFIDTEHIPLDRTEIAWMCQAYRAMNVAPLVRVTSPDPFQATNLLDGGAVGIVVPYVETVEQVKDDARRGQNASVCAVSFCRISLTEKKNFPAI